MSSRPTRGSLSILQRVPLTAKGALVVALPLIALAIVFTLFYDSSRGLSIALVAAGFAGLLGSLAAMYVFVRGIVRRVRRVEELARSVAGESAKRVMPGWGDEISRLEATLHETARLLSVQRGELRAAHDEMERRVEQRTAELSRANEELRHANELRQSLIRSAPLAIFSLDLEGRVVFWSPGAERMFGFSEKEAIGEALPVVPPGRRDEIEQAIARLRTGETMEGVERVHQRKDGTKVEVSIWAVPERDDEGNVNGFLTFVADITERKQLEEQFRQSQKLEAVGRLAGGVAHDFNNLLTVIMGYVEMLMAETNGSPGLLEYASEIQSAADRASALTGQLLAFSRRQIAQPHVLDLNQTIERSIKLLGRVIGEDISIRMHLDPGLAKIKADPTHVDQAIMNLVVNARDAMPHGGCVTIETANVALDNEYAGTHLGVKPGPYVMLAVSDNGIGMTSEIRERIFEPFFTTKESGKGTGLGLSIVYGVVKQNSGHILVYSEPGQGTCFKLYFPAEHGLAELAEAHRSVADVRGRETILLCEDEERIRKLVTIMLARQGYRVLEAGTPAAAISIAREHFASIDLLLTDIVMPDMSGIELAKAVRETRPGLKLLYMSGYTDNRVSGAWVLDPDTPFLHKPFTATALARKVREALGMPKEKGPIAEADSAASSSG